MENGEVAQDDGEFRVCRTECGLPDPQRLLKAPQRRVGLAAPLLEHREVVQAHRDLVVLGSESRGPHVQRTMEEFLRLRVAFERDEHRTEDGEVGGNAGRLSLFAESQAAPSPALGIVEPAFGVREAGQVVVNSGRGTGQSECDLVFRGGRRVPPGLLEDDAQGIVSGGDQRRV